MKSYIEHQSDLGPWNEDLEGTGREYLYSNIKSRIESDQKRMVEIRSRNRNNQINLPKMNNQMAVKLPDRVSKGQKNKTNLPVRLNPLKLELDKSIGESNFQLNDARKSKTLSFEPPLISFYNRKHPKVSKNRYSKATIQQYIAPKSQRISKLDLFVDSVESERKSKELKFYKSPTGGRSSDYEFAKKRSIREVFKYMKYHEIGKNKVEQLDKSLIGKLKIFRELEDQSKNDYYIAPSKKFSNFKRRRR